MSIYQISKIQIRRGTAQGGTGVPQLASGELAWAIDTQELYIGNGSVSEGAPNVGNTKIITTTDNIFELFDYQYKGNFKTPQNSDVIQTGLSNLAPTLQKITDVLDRTVWAENFGISPNNSAAANNEAIQRAIIELYLNDDILNTNIDVDTGTPRKDFRVELKFSPGQYNFSETIYLPSYVTITGAGIEKTIFNYTGTGSAFEFVSTDIKDYVKKDSYGNTIGVFDKTTVINGALFDAFVPTMQNIATASTQPKYTNLNNFSLTLENSTANGIRIVNLRDSKFQNIQILGPWSALSANVTYGINLLGSSVLPAVTCSNNNFSNLIFKGFNTGIYSTYNIKDNVINQCRFDGSTLSRNVKYGIVFGTTGQGADGPQRNIISNCKFESISDHGIQIRSGLGNKTRGNDFVNVGNTNLNSHVPAVSNIQFDSPGNSSLHDTFDRYDLSVNNTTHVYIPEIEGIAYHQNFVTKQTEIVGLTGLVARLPLNPTTGYQIDYIYTSVDNMRKGTLNIAVDDKSGQIQLTDEYECTEETPLVGTIPSQQQQATELLEFSAELTVNHELLLNYNNNTGLPGLLTFTYNVLIQA